MASAEYIIDIDAGRQPYNSHLTLSLAFLQKLVPLLKEEILRGMVNSDADGRVILHLHLDADKIRQVEDKIREIAKKAA